MRLDDVAALAAWDDDADVASAIGGRGSEWYDWPVELARDPWWRELLIVEEAGRPVGFVQLADAAAEESHYWGDVEQGTWSLDIWIGSGCDRGRGLGADAMRQALDRVFGRHGARRLLIDPRIGNHRAIAFYERLGFVALGERTFDDGDRCLVMVYERPEPS